MPIGTLGRVPLRRRKRYRSVEAAGGLSVDASNGSASWIGVPVQSGRVAMLFQARRRPGCSGAFPPPKRSMKGGL